MARYLANSRAALQLGILVGNLTCVIEDFAIGDSQKVVKLGDPI